MAKRSYLIPLFIGLLAFIFGSKLIGINNPCANSITCKDDPALKIENDTPGVFQGRVVAPPKIDLTKENTKSSVLGENVPSGNKHIYVNLATQTLYAYQGDRQIMKTRISSGKWGKTPAGNFNIYMKLRATRMTGGSGADYYNLPNVPHTMFYDGDFGIHGAYWHNNFGHEMSHGCINMRLVDAEKLFTWADGPTSGQPGTPVSICNEFEAPNLCIQRTNI